MMSSVPSLVRLPFCSMMNYMTKCQFLLEHPVVYIPVLDTVAEEVAPDVACKTLC